MATARKPINSARLKITGIMPLKMPILMLNSKGPTPRNGGWILKLLIAGLQVPPSTKALSMELRDSFQIKASNSAFTQLKACGTVLPVDTTMPCQPGLPQLQLLLQHTVHPITHSQVDKCILSSILLAAALIPTTLAREAVEGKGAYL